MCVLLWPQAIPASSIVNKLNIMSYNSPCTIRTITVVVELYMFTVCARAGAGAEDNESR